MLQVFEGSQPDVRLFEPVRQLPRRWHKPAGGLWTADYIGGPLYSTWILWCIGANFKGPEYTGWALSIEADNVLRFEKPDDIDRWQGLPEREAPPHISAIDWETLSIMCDGLYIGEEFLSEFRLSFGIKYADTIYSWDVPSILWFRGKCAT